MIQIDRLKADYGLGGEDFHAFTIQDSGGTRRAIEEGLTHLKTILPRVNAVQRTPTPASELVIGLQCGGSDGWSGVTSNPALGNAADRLVALGGTVILSETRRSTAPSTCSMRVRARPRFPPSCARGSTGGRHTPAATVPR